MPDVAFQTPTQIALTKLREKIAQDASLSANVKKAALDDLNEDDPTALARLRTVLLGEKAAR